MAGSLLELHGHDNYFVLAELTDSGGILFYKGKKIAGAADLSKEAGNAIVAKEDGIYVDGKLLCSKKEKDLLAKLSIDETQGFMFDGQPVSHTHDNKEILDKFSFDNTLNNLLYNSKKIQMSDDLENVDIEQEVQETLDELNKV